MLNCLVVEDDASLRRIYEFILTKEGYCVGFAKDADEAFAFISHTIPELIFLDVRLPRVSGLEVLSALRQNPAFDTTRIVVISSQEYYERELVGAEFLLKPVHPSTITQIAQTTRQQVKVSYSLDKNL